MLTRSNAQADITPALDLKILGKMSKMLIFSVNTRHSEIIFGLCRNSNRFGHEYSETPLVRSRANDCCQGM